MPADDKTEPATPRKRQELRRRGRVCKSQDLGSIVCFLGIVLALRLSGGATSAHLRKYLVQCLDLLQSHPILSYQSVGQAAFQALAVVAYSMGPVVVCAILLGVLVNGLQTNFLFAPEAMKVDLAHINPLTGVQRLVSGRGMVEAAKASVKIGLVGYLAYGAISESYPQLLSTARQDLPTAVATIGDVLYRLTLRTSVFLLVLAAADYAYQRYQFEKSIRMSKYEVKEEAKSTEGSPVAKSRLRGKIRQMYRKIMKGQVAKADVVVTNPTHYAVALRYDPATMSAPVVVAKGVDYMALHIRELAKEYDIPIVENPPLARALYKSVEMGEEVPASFYVAIAEVLAYVYQIDARRKRPAWATG
jgi:flagellar biosynthetic protein FlhB